MRANRVVLASVALSLSLLSPGVCAGDPITPTALSRILRVDADGSNFQLVLPPELTRGFDDIDLDTTNDVLYWGGFWESAPPPNGYIGAIRRIGVEGGSAQFVTIGVGGVKVDSARGKVYFTTPSDCGGCTKIHRANLDGTDVEQIASDVYFGSIGLNSSAGKLYWLSEDGIVRANLDGSDQQTVVHDPELIPQDIDVDEENGKLYWLTPFTGSLNRSNLDGTQVEQLLDGLPNAQGLTLDASGNRLWWTNSGDGTVKRATLDGSNVTTILTGLVEPRGIVYRAGVGQGGGRLYFLSDPELVVVPAASTGGLIVLLCLFGISFSVMWFARGE